MKTDLIHQVSRRLRTPQKVQKFLRKMHYNREEDGSTLRSAEQALRIGKAHCFEAAFLAAAILEPHGYPPQVISFESKDGLDHVIYVFQENGRWGAIARSRDEGLHGRAPVYRSLRALAWSYVDPYVDKSGRITAYQLAHLDDSKANWRTSRKNVWKAERYLLELKHLPLKASNERHQKTKKAYLKRGPLLAGKNWW